MKQRLFVFFASVLLLASGSLAGCQSFGPLRIQPVSSNQAVVLSPNFLVAGFRVDQDGNYYFYFESRSPGGGSPTGIRQILILRVFWKPKPGVTTLDPSAINSTMRFIIITPNGSGMYEGAGFVRIHGDQNSQELSISIVDGELRLTSSSGYFHDALGPSRIVGDQDVVQSPDRTLALIEQARRDFFLATFSQRHDTQSTGPADSTQPTGVN
jgi:hypothetical protein